MSKSLTNHTLWLAAATVVGISACSESKDTSSNVSQNTPVPEQKAAMPSKPDTLRATGMASAIPASDVFDLSHWKITIPLDENKDGKADTITDLQSYIQSDFFYLNKNKEMVFKAPNKAVTTANSSNTRSELHQMLRGLDTRIKNNSPKNNFAIKAHDNSAEFGAIGGKMNATLAVNHVAKNAQKPEKYPAFSVVVGQIHAAKLPDTSNGFGWGNEPLKIYYKKHPNHKMGSVFWTYERNLAKADPNRTDIVYPVWGNTWESTDEPGEKGVALDEYFSYEVNVYENTMHLTFTSKKHDTVTYSINLADNVDAYGKVDNKDFAHGYTGDAMYFKAGAYNQCSTSTKEGFWYAGCNGTGVWENDYANSDFVQVTFSHLTLSESTAPAQ